MSFSFYIYTILIMGVALVTSSVALVVWLMTRRRDAIISAIGFLAYMLDLSVIFFDEYNRMKYDYAVSFEMPLQHPGTRCLLGIVIIGCLFAWTILRLRDKLTIKRLAQPRSLQYRLPWLCVLALSAHDKQSRTA